jgi:predicted negative regulator of RcsB-dependent stress response
VLLLKKPTEAAAARDLLAWAADADLDAEIVQVANYALAFAATDKGEQEARHALSAAGPDPQLAALSGLRAGVLAVARGDTDAAEAMFTLASKVAIVDTPDGPVTIDDGCWAATHLGALLIGQNRLREAESAYTVALVSNNRGVADAVRQGSQRIAQLRAAQQQATQPRTVG